MSYKLVFHESEDFGMQSVKRDLNGVVTFIPFDPANGDYQEYLEWVADGNEPIAADEPVEITI